MLLTVEEGSVEASGRNGTERSCLPGRSGPGGVDTVWAEDPVVSELVLAWFDKAGQIVN